MSYPILSIPFPIYQPAMRIISNITNYYPALVTTTINHQYINGAIIRLYIPQGYGMVQANHLYANIIVTSPTTFTINIDTRLFSAFTTPITYPEDTQYAQCVPLGEVNSSLLSATKNVLPY